ncbi:sulfite exporter TauE/SafE family protein [Rhabdothermincola sp.]|uniref:sulfite exporter TauE/SafE family protein n=1 Tax=Rhabdothermincola sp. TaxID=2820405 RepID=UPI002FDF9339
MSPFTFFAAATVMAAGAAVQGSVGFGAALVAAPLLALIDPTFVPAPLILAALILNILMLRRERGSHLWRAVAWPIAGQIPGALMGAGLLALAADDHVLGVVFGAMILVAVALSISGLRAEPTPPVLFAAGSLSGVMQSTVGAGGPPIALALQGRSGPDLRAALARYFTVSCLVSLGFLVAVGQVGGRELVDAAVLLPGAVVGFLASGWVSRHVDGVVARRSVLILSAIAALAVLARSLA